ncbi:hypothetical protein [Frankia sp. AgKG'84/4]|nr:hypothetical protein [Frankia sp. AgKG'84/4]
MNRLGGEVGRPWGKDLGRTAMTAIVGYRSSLGVRGLAVAFGPATAHGQRPVQGTGALTVGEITGCGTCDGALGQTSGVAALPSTAGWDPMFAEHARVSGPALAVAARPTAEPARSMPVAQAQAHLSADRHLISGSARDPLPD